MGKKKGRDIHNYTSPPRMQTTNIKQDLADLCTSEFCNLCKVNLSDPVKSKSHYEGKFHSKRVALYLVPTEDTSEDLMECKVCKLVVSSPKVLAVHLNGKRHKKRMERKELSGTLKNDNIDHMKENANLFNLKQEGRDRPDLIKTEYFEFGTEIKQEGQDRSEAIKDEEIEDMNETDMFNIKREGQGRPEMIQKEYKEYVTEIKQEGLNRLEMLTIEGMEIVKENDVLGSKKVKLEEVENMLTEESGNPVDLLKQKNKYLAMITIDSDSDEGEQKSESDGNFQPTGVETSMVNQVSSTPRRERQFLEIEKAELKNIQPAESKRILAKMSKTNRQKDEKQFSSLSEVERAKFKNISLAERKRNLVSFIKIKE